MNILIVNDDGIYASQLPALVKWAQKYGDVTVVAPKVEQSGIAYFFPIFAQPAVPTPPWNSAASSEMISP